MNMMGMLTALLLLPGPLPALEPRMYRLGPAHLGVDSGPARVFRSLAWSCQTRGKVRSTPAVDEGVAFFGSDDGRFRAVDLKDGRELWGVDIGTPIPCSPALAGELVIFQGRDNVLRALDRRTGACRWTFAGGADLPARAQDYLGWDFWVSSPAVEGDAVFAGSGDGRVYALDLKTGRRLWAFATAQRVRASPAVKDGLVFAASFDGFVYALEAATGKERWRFDTGGGIQSSPAVWEGTVFLGSRSAAVFALDAATGALKWRRPHPNGSWVLSSPAVAEGKVVVGSSDEQFLQALDARTGEEVWRTPMRYRVLASPVVAGGLVYAGTEGAYTHALDLRSGLLVDAFYGAEGPVNASPALAGAWLLLPSDDQGLHGFLTDPMPERKAADPGTLGRLVGRYLLGSGILTLSLRNGCLAFQKGEGPGELFLLGADGAFVIPARGLGGILKIDASGAFQLAFRLGDRERIATRIP